jgi:hypothetical protein
LLFDYSPLEIKVDDKLCQEFEEDPYIERLLKLRISDPVIYYTYPAAVRDG